MTPGHALMYALRSLRRGGQHTLLALICVAFGIMSLVALQSLSTIIANALMADPRQVLGGDAIIASAAHPLSLAELERLRSDGTIAGYSPLSDRRFVSLRVAGSGRVIFLNRALGISPQHFPLVGEVRLAEPGASLADLLARPGDAVITRDAAWRTGVQVGDRVVLDLSDGDAAPPQQLTITGIADLMPDHMGGTMLYSLETADLLAGAPAEGALTGASIVWGPGGSREADLAAAGYQVNGPEAVEASRKEVSELFGLMLKGAGLVGLLVGGLAVAGTLRVMLERRTLEIAVLKTTGYTRRDLLLIFAAELGLLGAAGGAVGALAGTALSYPLVVLLGRTGTFLMDWRPEPLVLAGGVLLGAITALIFGADAVLRAALVRPAALLRPTPIPPRPVLTLITYGAIGLAYTVVAGLVLGSALVGAGVVLAAVIALATLGTLLSLVCAGLARLPLPGPPELTLARQGLRRETRRAALALVAIFAGTLCIGIAGASIASAYERMRGQLLSTEGYNLLVRASPGDEASVLDQLAAAGASQLQSAITLPVTIRAGGEMVEELRTLEARPAATAAWDLEVVEGAWAGDVEAALVPAHYREEGWQVGDTLEVAPGQEAPRPLRIAGFYVPADVGVLARPLNQLIVAREGLTEAAASGALRVDAALPASQLEAAAQAVGAAMPEALVISVADLSVMQARSYIDLFLFVAAVAGLALVAAAMLIANTVGLAMVQRAREIAVLKAVGLSRGRVLAVIVLEHSLVGLIGGAAGLAGAGIAVALINLMAPQAQLGLHPLLAIGILALAVGVTLASAATTARRPAGLRPLAVLREV